MSKCKLAYAVVSKRVKRNGVIFFTHPSMYYSVFDTEKPNLSRVRQKDPSKRPTESFL